MNLISGFCAVLSSGRVYFLFVTTTTKVKTGTQLTIHLPKQELPIGCPSQNPLNPKAMTPIKAACEILVVPVPEDARTYYLTKGGIAGKKLVCFNGQTVVSEVLIPQEYQIVGKVGEVTEEQAHEIVDTLMMHNGLDRVECYPHPYKDSFCKTALDSLTSLLKANGIEGENYVILKKV